MPKHRLRKRQYSAKVAFPIGCASYAVSRRYVLLIRPVIGQAFCWRERQLSARLPWCIKRANVGRDVPRYRSKQQLRLKRSPSPRLPGLNAVLHSNLF